MLAERDALQARCDLLEREAAELQVQLAAAREAQAPGAFDERVHRRAELIVRAQRVLGDSFRGDGMSERAIHEAVIAKAFPRQINLANESSDYLRARFDAAVDGGVHRSDALDHARRITTPVRTTAQAERHDAKEPYVPPWMRPTSVTKRNA